jgi:hypothetical protein
MGGFHGSVYHNHYSLDGVNMTENHDAREAQLMDIMYAIGMESAEAHFHMELLCAELGIPFPPRRIEPVQREVAYEIAERKRLDWMDQQGEME